MILIAGVATGRGPFSETYVCAECLEGIVRIYYPETTDLTMKSLLVALKGGDEHAVDPNG